MPYSILPPPILFVGDCRDEPPAELVKKYLSDDLVAYAHNNPDKTNQILWSRLIIASVPKQSSPSDPPSQTLLDTHRHQMRLKGDWYRYCSIDFRNEWVAVALHMMPISICLKWFDISENEQELTRLGFPPVFNHWIDRQENPELAFYQYWTLQECIKRRSDPTIRAQIGDDDRLSVRGATTTLHENITFWTSDSWICAVQGPALATLLVELRTTEKTIKLLES